MQQGEGIVGMLEQILAEKERFNGPLAMQGAFDFA